MMPTWLPPAIALVALAMAAWEARRYALGLIAMGLPLYALMRLRRRADPAAGVPLP